MNDQIKEAVQDYQCPGCMKSSFDICFTENSVIGQGCSSHSPGTFMALAGAIFLGLPKGFNRIGPCEGMIPIIFSKYTKAEEFNMWNIPVWKHLNSKGHTLVRGIRPRRNEPFLIIFLENCIDKINCQEISAEQIKNMD